MKHYHVYIMVSRKNGTLYIGVTDDLKRRVYEHQHNVVPGFTSRYKVHTLVYVGEFISIREAIAREKQLKEWRREWKIKLIEEQNPSWRDLSLDF